MRGLATIGFVILMAISVVSSSTTAPPPEPTIEPEVTTKATDPTTSVAETTTGTTPAGQTTTIPATLSPATEVGQWHVKDGNNVCIMFTQSLDLNFTYYKSDSLVTKTIHLPVNASASGSCSNETQEIVLTWPNFQLKYTFERPLRIPKSNYYVKTISLHYNMTKEQFPDITTEHTDLTAGFDNETLYEAVIGQSYRCNSSQSLVYEKYVASADGFTSLTHQHLKTEAFRDTNTTIYSTDEVMCDDDLEVSNIVPIAVGAALAALVVIVLIAYIIGRRTRKRGYESV